MTDERLDECLKLAHHAARGDWDDDYQGLMLDGEVVAATIRELIAEIRRLQPQ